MAKTKILVVDDHAVFRHGIVCLLGQDARFEVIGEAEGGEAAMTLIAARAPDIVVLDLSMPGMDGVELLARMRRRHAGVRAIVLSQHVDNANVLELTRIGVEGYILKSEPLDEIVRALETVLRGELYFSPRVGARFFEVLHARGARPAPLSDARSLTASAEITRREREVASWIVQGKTNKEIGVLLNCSDQTVKVHKANLMRKIGAKNSAELSAWAVKTGVTQTG